MKRSLAFILVLPLLVLSCGGDDGAPGSNPNNITFTSEPPTQIDHNRLFQFSGRATHKSGDPVSIKITAPGWLVYDEPTNQVIGTPDWARLNQSFRIIVMATNGIDTAFQRNDIQVNLGEIICDSNFGNPEDSPYVLPYEVGETFKVNQTYCPSNPNWGHFNWFAYDFETPMGTNIVAMRAGQVFATQSDKVDHILDCSGSSANFVFVQHDDGTVAQYVHLMQNGVRVQVGDRVEAGQLLGLSGNTGCSAGPHLHVNIFKQRGPYIRQYTLPFNFSNADGPLNSRKGLEQGGFYTAL